MRNTAPTALHDEAPRRGYSTDEAAALMHVRPQTLRAALCRDGAYLGVRPVKLPNRLLSWPAEKIDLLAAGGRLDRAA